MLNKRFKCSFFIIVLLAVPALGSIPSFDEEDGVDLESSGGYEFLDEEFSGPYTDLLDEYLGGSGEFPLEDFDSEDKIDEEEEGSTFLGSDPTEDSEKDNSEKDDFPLEEMIEEDDIHFVENTPSRNGEGDIRSPAHIPTTSSSTTESNYEGHDDIIRHDEPDSTFLFANRLLFFVLYGAAIMVLFVAILLVICLLIQCRKKRKESMNLMNKARVVGINNSLSKNSRDSIIIDCYRIHKNPLGYKV